MDTTDCGQTPKRRAIARTSIPAQARSTYTPKRRLRKENRVPSSPARRMRRWKVFGIVKCATRADGRGSFMLLGITRDDYPALSAGSKRPGAGDLYVSVR